MTKRYPICNHTLSAVRGRQPGFRVEAEHILRNGVTKAALDRLALTASRIFTELEPDEMPECQERKPVGGNYDAGLRR